MNLTGNDRDEMQGLLMDASTSNVLGKMLRVAATAGTIGALWFAAAAPLFQGNKLH